ncbi:MAG: group I intron-associated PD-(D/E)XK endonuclease [Candidatus Sulfotelmatobacter sp.]
MENQSDNSEGEQQPEEPIEIQAVSEPSDKRRGEAAEAEFIARAQVLGFSALKPWGECNRYDVVIDHGSGFWRIQVKLSSYSCQSRYHLVLSIRGVTYTAAEIDFVAGYIAPLNLWYIIPIELVASQSAVSIFPHTRRGSKYERYREAWCLLDCTREARGWNDIPAVCRCPQLAVRCAVCPLQK